MVEGEYESILALYNLDPSFVPRPTGWGTLEADPTCHFFLTGFLDMSDKPDDVKMIDFCNKVTALHEKSMSSPAPDFGFHITTYAGRYPQLNHWNSSWEVFFDEELRELTRLEHESHEPTEEFTKLLAEVHNKLIPRLLRPLETEGRSVTPCLL